MLGHDFDGVAIDQRNRISISRAGGFLRNEGADKRTGSCGGYRRPRATGLWRTGGLTIGCTGLGRTTGRRTG